MTVDNATLMLIYYFWLIMLHFSHDGDNGESVMGKTHTGRRLFYMAPIIAFLCIAGCSGGSSSKVDTTDYKAVAVDFLETNALIARKIGKVSNIDHFGVGGTDGDRSYNVYRIRSDSVNAVCHITLTRDDKSRWAIEQAIMTVGGQDYKLPVKRYELKRSLKLW